MQTVMYIFKRSGQPVEGQDIMYSSTQDEVPHIYNRKLATNSTFKPRKLSLYAISQNYIIIITFNR